MLIQASEREDSQLHLTDDDRGRYLLHYLLTSRGICEENVLLMVLMRLYPSSDVSSVDFEEWRRRLQEVIRGINVKLNALDYKVVQISHGLGKNIVASKSTEAIEFCANDLDDSSLKSHLLRATNRFYVYVDVGAVHETKMATRFSAKEIEFIKFAIQETRRAGSEVRQDGVPSRSAITQEVNRIRRLASEKTEMTFTHWNGYATFSVGSTQLTQSKVLNSQEVEDMIMRLCEYKWFCRNSEGKISLDLRCIAELEDDLISTYGFPSCQNCQRLAIQGVMCPHENHSHTLWHVDCYQYQITHQDTNCPICGESLLTNGIYVI